MTGARSAAGAGDVFCRETHGDEPLRRFLAATIAWVTGVGVYLVAAVVWGGYDGFPSFFLLPTCAAAASAAVVGLALLVGLAVRPTPIGRVWRSRRVWAASTAAGGVAVLCLGSAAGLTGEYIHPDTSERFAALHPRAALGGYFLLLFGVANWPRGERAEAEPTEEGARRGDHLAPAWWQ